MGVFSLRRGQYRWTHIEYELVSVQNSCPTNLASWVELIIKFPSGRTQNLDYV